MTDTKIRTLVHAVIYPDGDVDGMSIVEEYADGSFHIMPYTGEEQGICFSNSIAVIAPEPVAEQFRNINCNHGTVQSRIAFSVDVMRSLPASIGLSGNTSLIMI